MSASDAHFTDTRIVSQYEDRLRVLSRHCQRGNSVISIERAIQSETSMTANSFDIGAMVGDRDAPMATPRIVVALPATAAADWITYGGTTVAQDNPTYPADTSLVIVVDAAAVDTYLPDWDHETALSRATLDERGIYYEALPAPRLTTDKETPTAD